MDLGKEVTRIDGLRERRTGRPTMSGARRSRNQRSVSVRSVRAGGVATAVSAQNAFHPQVTSSKAIQSPPVLDHIPRYSPVYGGVQGKGLVTWAVVVVADGAVSLVTSPVQCFSP